jgi:hypothetical protein
MKTITHSIAFGAVAGGIWALVPGTLSELFTSQGQTLSVFTSGILTGIIVTLTLNLILDKRSRRFGIIIGALSLPYGAFVFGIVISLVHQLILSMGGPRYGFVIHKFEPLEAGLTYALYSSISIFALVLFPLAIATTLALQEFNKNN